MTGRNSYPAQKMNKSIGSLGKVQIISSPDFSSGYFQITLDGRDKVKTAFFTHYRLFKYTCMLFGLWVAPDTVHRVTNLIFASV